MARTFARAGCLLVVSVLSLSGAVASATAATRSASLNAAAQSDLRNLATTEEIYLTDYLHYGSFAQLAQDQTIPRFHIAQGITIAIVHLDGARGYCFRATTNSRTYMYDALAGGIYVGTHCRRVIHGRFGGRRVGPAWVPNAPGGAQSPPQTDLRNLATLEESYYTDHAQYATFDELVRDPTDGVMRIHSGVTITIVHLNGVRTYCLHATDGNQSYMFDSGVGGQNPYPGSVCRFTKSGPSGGTRTGPATV